MRKASCYPNRPPGATTLHIQARLRALREQARRRALHARAVAAPLSCRGGHRSGHERGPAAWLRKRALPPSKPRAQP